MWTDLEQKVLSLFTSVKESFDDTTEFPACEGAANDVFKLLLTCDVSDTEYVRHHNPQSRSITFTHKKNQEDRHVIKQVTCIMKWEASKLKRFHIDLLNRPPYPNKLSTECPYTVSRQGLSFEQIRNLHTGIWEAGAHFTDICAGPRHAVVIWKRPFNKTMALFDASNKQFRENYPSSLLVSEDVLNGL